MKSNELYTARIVDRVDRFSEHQTRTALAYVRDCRMHLQITGMELSKHALSMGRYSSTATVGVIVLGAFVSTKAVMDTLIGSTNLLNVLIYALAGLLIAVLSGLQSAFKWNSKAAEMRRVAARCRRSEHAIDMGLRTIQRTDLIAATALLKQADMALDEVESEALKIGVDLQKAMYLGMSVADLRKMMAHAAGRKPSAMLEELEENGSLRLEKV